MNQWIISYFETRTLLLFYFFYHHSWSAYPGSFVGTSVIQRAITALFHSSNPLKLSYGESGRAVLQVEEGIREESCGPSTHPDDSGIISYFSPRLPEIKSRRIEDVLMWRRWEWYSDSSGTPRRRLIVGYDDIRANWSPNPGISK